MIQSPINWLSMVSGEVFHRERGSCRNMADSKKMPTGAQVCPLFFKSHYIGVLKNAFRHSGQKNITDRVPGTGVILNSDQYRSLVTVDHQFWLRKLPFLYYHCTRNSYALLSVSLYFRFKT